MPETKPIHTLNARGHVLLEVMRDHFKLSPTRMHLEIQAMREEVERVLAEKGIRYDQLKSALVPTHNRHEMALIFDTLRIDDSWYGYEVMKRVIPLFERESNHSVLVGDYLDRPGQADAQYEAFKAAVTLRQSIEYRHPTQFYIVYISNLTQQMMASFDAGLTGYQGYCGFADLSHASAFKVYLSTMLVNSFIKHGRFIIQGAEPGSPEEEDCNVSGYPFEENGYEIRSVPEHLMGPLLSYKIERPVFEGFEVDTEFALNAVTDAPQLFDDFDIEVADAKLKYLKSQKAGSIKKAGLETISADQLAAIIKAKIQDSYIYNISYLEEHNVIKFNIVLELPVPEHGHPARMLAALSYEPDKQSLRLVTLY